MRGLNMINLILYSSIGGSGFNNSIRGTSNINSLITRLQNAYPSFADGGRVSGAGTSTSDSIMAMLSDGEYIIRNSSVDNVGVNTLDYINNTGTTTSRRH